MLECSDTKVDTTMYPGVRRRVEDARSNLFWTTVSASKVEMQSDEAKFLSERSRTRGRGSEMDIPEPVGSAGLRNACQEQPESNALEDRTKGGRPLVVRLVTPGCCRRCDVLARG